MDMGTIVSATQAAVKLKNDAEIAAKVLDIQRLATQALNSLLETQGALLAAQLENERSTRKIENLQSEVQELKRNRADLDFSA